MRRSEAQVQQASSSIVWGNVGGRFGDESSVLMPRSDDAGVLAFLIVTCYTIRMPFRLCFFMFSISRICFFYV